MKLPLYITSIMMAFVTFLFAQHEDCNHDHEPPILEAEHADCDHDEHEEHELHNEHATCDDHDGHDHADEGGVKVSHETAIHVGLKIQTAKGGEISKTVVFPAEISLNRDRFAAVSPRYASVVRQVFAQIGDTVNKGDILASLENRDTLAVYTVAAPLSGEVLSKDLSDGESVDESHVLFEVANLSSVWADTAIFPAYRSQIKKGQTIEFVAHDGSILLGTINYITPIINHETRTFTARCVLTTTDPNFTAGTFVRARIQVESMTARVRIEREAVQTIEGSSIVFIPHEERFKTRDVQLGMADDHYVEIKAGLDLDESYVAGGAFSLKAELVTSGMDPHAGHGH